MERLREGVACILSFVRPLSRAMLHEEDVDLRIGHTIRDDVRCAGDNQFACALDLAGRPAKGLSERILAVFAWIVLTMRDAPRGLRSEM